MGYQPLENYGIIGDLGTAALAGMDGSVDFLCFPRFDSPTVFAALLDDERGGRFQLSPALGDARQKQLYLPDSNILLSRFLSAEGVAEVSDFLPVHAGGSPTLIRRAKAVRGEVRFRLVCAPRFDYGRAPHRAELRGRDVFFHFDGPGRVVLRLRSDVPARLVNGDAAADFTLRAGEAAAFILDAPEPRRPSPSDVPDYVARAFKETSTSGVAGSPDQPTEGDGGT